MNNGKKAMLVIFAIFILLTIIPAGFAINNDNLDDISVTQDNCDDTVELSDNNEDIIDNAEDVNIEDAIYVSKQGNDEFNGSSEKPVSTVKKAIELANNTTSHKIIINDGSYIENDLVVSSQLDISANGTVTIDGNLKSTILTIDTKKEVNISGIIFKNGWDGAIVINKAKVTIDNCTFINSTSDYGGAIQWNANNGVLSNSYFTKNHARIGSAVLWGAREENDDENKGDNGLIINVTFEDNDNKNSGAGCMGLAVYGDNVKITDSKFINNNAPKVSTGGSLHILGDYATVDNCLFENNSMDQAPALQSDGDYVTIINSRFINNTISSTDSAKGGSMDIKSPNAQIINNTFENNGGENCYNGGAISVSYDGYKGDEIINITNNRFTNNSAVYGGALFVDGGYENYCEFDEIILNNNIFESNSASTTAGIYVRYSDIENTVIYIENNVFRDLTANHASALFIDYSSVKLKNNTIINCLSFDENNEIFNNDGYIMGNLTVTVNNNDTLELYSGKSIEVNASLVDDMNNSISGGTVHFIVEDNDINEDGFSLENGVATVEFYSTQDGIYLISADYVNGDKGEIKTSMIVSLPYVINIAFNETEGLCGESISVPAIVSVNGYLIDGENITVLFNGTRFDVPVVDGLANIYVALPDANGTYNLTAVYDIKNETKSILVKDNSVILEVPDVSTTPNAGELKITLKDMEKNPIENQTIAVKINGSESEYKTDENGAITIPLNLSKGDYSAEVKYAGGKYKAAETESMIKVDYLKVILTASDINMVYNDGSTYTVRITDSNYHPLANQTLNIKFNGKTTQVSSDKNGVATLLIKSSPNTYTISTEYGGNNVYGGLTIKNTVVIKSLAKLKGSNINMYYSDNKYYKVRLYGNDGKAVGSGKTINIKVNGITHKVKTDKKGYASLKITLNPKTYTVTVSYGKLKTTNKIVVKKVLSAKNISKKKSKKIKFTAKLSKGSKVLANKKVKFKISGKTYTVKTNKKGIAGITLKNLKAKTYTIYTYYGTSKIKNTIKIKK